MPTAVGQAPAAERTSRAARLAVSPLSEPVVRQFSTSRRSGRTEPLTGSFGGLVQALPWAHVVSASRSAHAEGKTQTGTCNSPSGNCEALRFHTSRSQQWQLLQLDHAKRRGSYGRPPGGPRSPDGRSTHRRAPAIPFAPLMPRTRAETRTWFTVASSRFLGCSCTSMKG